jgi:hypothetical protein
VPNCVLAFEPPQLAESSKLMRTDQPQRSPNQDAPSKDCISQQHKPELSPDDPLSPDEPLDDSRQQPSAYTGRPSAAMPTKCIR